MRLEILESRQLLSSASAPASTFDTDADGWTLQGDGELAWVAGTGEHGGFLSATDPGDAQATLAVAPSKFLGDWSGLDGQGSLSLDQRILSDTDTERGPIVRLSGPGGSARYALSSVFAPSKTDWSHYSVPIRQDAWELLSGNWHDLLGQVTKFTVDMEFVSGAEQTALDNVSLSGDFDPGSAPRVIAVLVKGSGWSSNTLNYLEAQGLGVGGYALPVGSGAQLAPLPWSGIDRIMLQFSEPVEVHESDLILRGVNTPGYAFSSFVTGLSTDGKFQATWRLAEPLGTDKFLLSLSEGITDALGNALDGEWANPTLRSTPAGGSDSYPSGDGTAGGAFQFRFNVIPGDANQNGGVNVQDVVLVRNRQGSSTAVPANYSVFNDVNANSGINVQDVVLTRNQQGKTLPAGEPSLPAGALAALVIAGSPPTASEALVVSGLSTALLREASALTTTTPGAAARRDIAPAAFTASAGEPVRLATTRWSLRSADAKDDDLTLLRKLRHHRLGDVGPVGPGSVSNVH